MAQVLELAHGTNILSENVAADILKKLQSASKTSSTSADNSDNNLQVTCDHESSEDAPKHRVKRRIRQFSDSDNNKETRKNTLAKNSDSDSDAAPFKSFLRKSRIRKANKGSSSDSDSPNLNQAVNKCNRKDKPKLSLGSDTDSDSLIFTSISHKSRMQKVSNGSFSDSDQAVKFEKPQTRIKTKKTKMKDKFKSLISSPGKDLAPAGSENESAKSSGESDDKYEAISINKIKQKIKKRMTYNPSICDPDTSDEETESNRQRSMPKQQKVKRTKLTSPKPQRMSAKQAMENMQKIKSESNRMLREKEVSLPYHRPKALSLKDIMSRRKPAVSSDGKSLPIKMNGDQLKQYAQMLEDRQKQMMELWQSDTDEENDDQKSDDEKATDNDKKSETGAGSVDESKEIELDSETAKDVNTDIPAEDNDKLFDDIFTTKTNISKENESYQVEYTNDNNVIEEQDSETSMKLVFNESETSVIEVKQDDADNVKEEAEIEKIKNNIINETAVDKQQVLESLHGEANSQLVSLHYDSEKLDTYIETIQIEHKSDEENTAADTDKPCVGIVVDSSSMDVDNAFSDDDMNIEDIDNIIENAEIIRDIEDKINSQVLIRDRPLNLNPKLTGSPGMVIDLEDSDTLPKKSGVELLKERFTFFAKLKTPEELERAKDRQIKPGNQHSRLKQELEEQMAEQRSLEWTKRLEDERQQQKELKEKRGDDSDDDNDIDKLEAKLEEGNEESEADKSVDESEEEDELLENDVEINDKPRAKNPMLDNEAEESDCENEEGNKVPQNGDEENYQEDEIRNGDDESDDAESSDDSESSESEEEQQTAKKGRILKAFEDSDDEDIKADTKETKSVGSVDLLGSQAISQDDVLTLAQRHKSVSEDLFSSQGSSLLTSQKPKSQTVPDNLECDVDLGTQTFSILDSTNNATAEFLNAASMSSSDKLNVICDTQPYDNLDAVAAMCSGSFSQSLPPLLTTQTSQSQPIGEDILALCTGKFYENEFISQAEDNNQTPLGASQDYDTQTLNDHNQSLDDETPNTNRDKVIRTQINNEGIDKVSVDNTKEEVDIEINKKEKQSDAKVVDDNLKSILEELDDPEFDTPKPNRFFCGAKTQKQTENSQNEQEIIKKKFTIDSDDDSNDANAGETKKRKKLKKKKPEKRALQISDDEEEVSEQEESEEYESEIEEEREERLVEYDSEENEIEIKPQNQKPLKKKRKGTEFFEQEAELTSEDEWAGSGDEDEAGLDRMEREAGDDESFHQGRLQRELGQIHMRDVLDQDKREVRIIQELLFEDGDLGAGGRHRKFKWKNLDGDEESGTGGDEFRDTQEEEFESEEQWRKQRHERETFLRQMQNNGDLDDSLNVSIKRTTIIKANLMSKTMSMLLEENQNLPVATNDSSIEPEKKKDSPKKPFSILQQGYQGSILNRGKGALARLAALATPLAVDDDAPKGKSAATSSGRNFVFATLTPEAPKVTKRKAVTNPGTPALVKKMKTEDKQNMSKSSLLDHMKL